MIYKDLPYIINSSQNIVYKFWLDSFNNLNVENYDESNINNSNRFIYKHSILDYSVDIDDMDRIHIIYTNKDGVLKYSTLDFPNVEKTISSVPSKDYKINYLTIKIISSNIHVFYMVQSKYVIDKWSINHSFLYNNMWNSKKLDEIYLIKKSIPYSIDFYKNNIYVFYSTNSQDKYCIQKFNMKFNMWSTIDTDILLTNCQNAELFINNLGIGAICYNSYISRNTNTLLKFKDFNVNSSTWSDGLPVRTNTYDPLLPSVLCRNDAIFLFWRDNDTLLLKKSLYETTSLDEKKLILYKDIISSCQYISNKNLQYTAKSNFLFFVNTTPPYTILEHNIVKEFLKIDFKKIEQKFNPLNGPLKETLKIITQNSNLNNKSIDNNAQSSDIENINIADLESNYTNFIGSHSLGFNDFKDKISKKTTGIDEIEKLKNDLYLKENVVEELKNSLILKDSEIKQFEDNLSLKNSELEQLKNNLNTNNNELVQLKGSLNIKDSELEQLKNILNLKNNEIEQFKNNLAQKESELEELNDSYASLKDLASENELLIQNLNIKIEKLELELQNKDKDTDGLETPKKKSFMDLFKT
ncbi:hypothetical protein [Clostridium sp. OS1-26]|uniref:hypothetical protein n=1 Tax=Clostridium sp. OS1-26 TaxID=3070681 RepID=UPI0027E0B0EB|nr:hypothetical protein [Clostridium sp. OS1-26]WML35825.1 hypothetical protein RCG18_03495 [Clostridium sp. OS1-26]